MLVSGPRLLRALRGEPRGKQESTYCGAPGDRAALLEGLGTRLRDMNYYRGNPHYLQRSLQEPVNIDTPEELGEYDDRINALLGRIFELEKSAFVPATDC